MDHEGARYLMVRYRPELPTAKERRRRDWVFLFESSGDRDPLLARTQIEVVRTLLANAEHDDTFAVVTAATRAGTFAPEARPVTADNAAAAVRFLDGTHLAGVLDLGKALDAAEPFLKAAQNPYLVHVGSGLPVLGDTRADSLDKRVPEGVHYVGVAVGKRWNRAFMKAAAERSGGFFTQINPDEPVNWRSFELYSALTAPRLLGVKVVDNAEKATFLTHTSAVAQGEEVCAIARLAGGARLPEAVTVTGTLDGKTFTRSLKVKDVAANAGYLPRTWAKLEIDRLLAENAQANKARVVQLSMASYVMTPYTSLLVLENDQMYKQFGVDRGRKDHWAMYPCPENIPIVHEPLGGAAAAAKPAPPARANAADVLATILVHLPPRAFADGAALPPAVTVRDLYAGAFAVPGPMNLDFGFPLDASGKDRPLRLWTGYGAKDAPSPRPASGPVSSSGGGMGPPGGPGMPGPGGVPPPPSGGGGAFPGGGLGGPGAGGMMPPGGGFGGGIGGFGGSGPSGSNRFGNNGNGQFSFSGGASFVGGSGGSFAGSSGSSFAGGGSGGFRGWPGPSTYTQPMSGPGAPGGGPGNPYSALAPNGNATSKLSYNYYLPYYYQGYAQPQQSLQVAADEMSAMKKAKNLGAATERAALLRIQELQQQAQLNPRLAAQLLRPLAGTERFDVNRPVRQAGKGEVKELDKAALDEVGAISIRGADEALAQQLEVLVAAQQWKSAVPLAVVRPDALLYHRPTLAPDARLFNDLVAFAPGLNTTRADVLGVLEAEAALDLGSPGAVEPAARALIEGARAAGWRTLTVPGAAGAPSWSVFFDGSGRYAAERVLASGLKEHVVCDGKELLHLYPELGLGSRRTVTRFHRADLADLVPWALPPAKDLAHGFDLKCVAERTVAVVPCGLKDGDSALVVQLVFADDGRLAERRWVELPKKTTRQRETYGADGTVKLLDGEDKVLSERKLALRAGGAPDLDLDTKSLAMLPMPVRTREHVIQQPGAAGGNVEAMDRAAWLALLATDAATGNVQGLEYAIRARAWNLGDSRPGLLALLLSAGYDINNLPLPANADRAPLGRYVAWLKKGDQAGEPKGLGDGLLAGLAEVQWLRRHWQQPGLLTEADCARMVKYVREAKSPLFAWAAVEEVLRTPDKKVTAPGGRAKVQRDVLRAATEALKDVPGLAYAARYEYALHRADNGERDEARKLLVTLYKETAKDGALPPVDRGLRQALRAEGHEPDLFAKLLRESAGRLVKDGRRVAAVALAWQCRELDAPALADELLDAALAGLAADEGRVAPTLAAVEYLAQTHQYDRADRLLDGLLADEKLARHTWLWRLGYQLALQRKQPARAFARLAEALELEYRARPEWIDVQAVRRDYGALLEHYAEVVRATATLDQRPPADLAAKVVRAADRWRALDPDGALACVPAFQSLRGLDKPDLAWDYLLMGSAADQAGFSWANLARSLAGSEDFDLAERAYAQACLVEPANGNLAAERADNLARLGRTAEARELRRHAAGLPPPQP